ncbi:23S rRNA (pseudouridine(1915)-N(3))-methyltransferase RlmH [Desulfofundulus sp. TPOSR]|jgi:23S rRNA (pseudouridine1915-N3)-methyltransferase|uniref:Ribosomal RNA large subunit methyltransferase H n=1 Tax=Desulfofundulus kuznetsovii (strain DSM 6115 / VKM B-1805 / 17) TaxID=760568 RepID=A0AAU8PTJ5_DESK7|nr:23S rRNA (pseudouridine(1915)-N(3))-methyltransferase RlmH [Desulfofundulus sp. TPOSR]AEG16975.1 Ribosomal RNA large subunit methyltransferase H [Desulfofundulus kuznetsovii DSM 6115]NHM26802.1 23S rRNA (pseudouridine(1915)-N(3))-methyltransferase RlmH [Desulfofundulus sp. TPOSR]
MQITLLCVGKLKEDFLRLAQREYLKRLKPYARLEVMEVREEALPPTGEKGAVEAVLKKEGEQLLHRIPENSYVIALDREGVMLTSEEFAGFLHDLSLQGQSRLCFIIGGSAGLAGAVLARASMRLSFSKFTFPHQLMRIILLEQVYRAFKIIRGERYHR